MVSVPVACLSDLFHSIIIEEGGAVPCLIMEQSHGAPCGGLVTRFRMPVQCAAVRDT